MMTDSKFKIIDWTDKLKNFNDRISLIVLHHTCSDSAQATINGFKSNGLSAHYLVDKDGSIYQLGKDEKRAWHAGVSQWGIRNNLNDTSVGIEIINMGDRPFTDVQVDAVTFVAKEIMKRFNVKARNIVSHADVAPGRKFDPSGYFDWQRFYSQLGVFDGLFVSKLSPDEQKTVRMDWSPAKGTSSEISALQKKLSEYGYKIKQSGKYDSETRYVVEAFNRHFCPEIFAKESIKDGKVVQVESNQKWFALSEERLNFLSAQK